MNVSQEIEAHLQKLDQRQLGEQDKADDLSVTIQLDLGGDQGGNYGLRIHNGQISTGSGYTKTPDLTFTMSAEDYLTIIKDEVNPMGMVLSGRIQVEGDKMLAMHVANILQGKS